MTPRFIFSIIFSLFVLFFTWHAAYLGKTVYGDGVYYYSHLQSLLGEAQPIPNNKYSIGPALFWMPTYLLAKNELSVGFSSVFYAITGLVLLYRLLITTFTQRISLATILLVAFTTNLLFYGSIDPANSHALSFFTVILFLSFLFARKKSWFAIGVSLGLVGTVRPQDLIVGILARSIKWRPFLAGLFAGFFPQMVSWFFIFGSPVALPYLGRGEGFSPSLTNVFGVLFAPTNGLFLWTPTVMLGCIGLMWYHKRFALVFIIELLIVASWSTWWQGESYSGRMFVGMLPIIAFGVAWILSKINIPKKALSLLVCSLSTINSILIIYFLATR